DAALSFLGRFAGSRPFVPAVMKIMFGRTFRSDRGRAALREGLARELIGNDLTGMRHALHGVLSRTPVGAEELAKIRAPVLIVSGEEDTAVASARSRGLAA